MNRITSVTVLGALAIVGECGLIGIGRTDAAALLIVPTLLIQVLNLVMTGSVESKVNGHMKALVAAKTQPDAPVAAPAEADGSAS